MFSPISNALVALVNIYIVTKDEFCSALLCRSCVTADLEANHMTSILYLPSYMHDYFHLYGSGLFILAYVAMGM